MRKIKKKHFIVILPIFFFMWLSLSACAGMRLNASAPPHIDKQATFAVLYLSNDTSTPYAGQRVQRQLAALLGAHGLTHVIIQPSNKNAALPVGNASGALSQALGWARAHHARYAFFGSVDEWRYKIGLDGQPAVGLTLRLIDVNTGKALWSGVASASGGSREGLAVLSQQVLNRLVNRLLSD